jgi:hypothetical protein
MKMFRKYKILKIFRNFGFWIKKNQDFRILDQKKSRFSDLRSKKIKIFGSFSWQIPKKVVFFMANSQKSGFFHD